MSYKTFAEVYKVGYSRAAHRCNSADLTPNRCPGGVTDINGSAEWTEGRSGKDRCTSICHDTLSGIPGQTQNPCIGPVKASDRKFIHRSGYNKLSSTGVDCDWNITDANLRTMSGNSRYTNSGIPNTNNSKVSVYDQLLFGIRTGPSNTEGRGYCDNTSHLLKVVHNDGRTCYEMVKTKIGEAEAMRKGRLLCAAQPGLKQCACINISHPDGVSHCLRNRRLPGCDKVVQSFEAIPVAARTQFNLVRQSTGCYNGTACAGSDVFKPEILPQVCNNTIAVCNQDIKMGDITGGKVNINQKMQCEAKSDSSPPSPSDSSPPPPSDSSPPPPSDSSPPPSDSSIQARIKEYIPRNLDELKTDKKKQMTVGGIVAILVVLILIIMFVALS